MNNVVALQPLRPRDYTPSQLSLVRRTVAKDTNEDEFSMFIEVCRRVGLDPFRRQIYCNVYSKDKPDKRQVVFITGIDGFRAVADRSRAYRPDENEPTIETRDDLVHAETNPKGLYKAVVTVWKADQWSQWHPIKGVAYWDEFAPVEDEFEWVDADGGKRKRISTGRKKLSGKWSSMPHLMLAKCAEAQALRKGWPEDLSAIYAPEEMARADVMDKTAAELVESAEVERRLAITQAANTVGFQFGPGQPIEFIPLGQVADRLIWHIRSLPAEAALNAFEEINRRPLQEFWSRAKADALGVKQEIEKMRANFSKETA